VITTPVASMSDQVTQSISDATDGLTAEMDSRFAGARRDTDAIVTQTIAAHVNEVRSETQAAISASEKRLVRKIVTDTTTLVVEQGNTIDDRFGQVEERFGGVAL
jgi:hypothetical protein